MNIPLSLYIHIPWCIRKCPYCDFNSHTLRNKIPEEQYIAQLLSDLQTHQTDIQDRQIHSIFIGGGTPSLLSASAYQQLLQALHQRLDISPTAEITLEANPGASEQQRFTGFREAGINRLSIGIQSWQDRQLQALGRVHDTKQAQQAVTMAKQAGFTRINLDIMYGLPQQSLAEALTDLQTTIACEPEHISWYQLTLEPHTYFHRFPPVLPEENVLWEIQQQGQQMLMAAGYQHYEVSAYCRGSGYSQHNLNYWQFGDYIGIGAGAHSKITNAQDGSVWRSWKVKNPRDYLAPRCSLLEGRNPVVSSELVLEFMMNAMRLKQPIPLSLFFDRTGLPLTDIQQPLAAAQAKELLIVDERTITVTPLGHNFLNQLLMLFLPSLRPA